jgi:hypothetical protein
MVVFGMVMRNVGEIICQSQTRNTGLLSCGKTRSEMFCIHQNYMKWAGRYWWFERAGLKKQISFWKN